MSDLIQVYVPHERVQVTSNSYTITSTITKVKPIAIRRDRIGVAVPNRYSYRVHILKFLKNWIIFVMKIEVGILEKDTMENTLNVIFLEI